jgi:hypothetical protein
MSMWRAVNIVSLALLVIGSTALTYTLRYQHDKNHFLSALTAQGNELTQTKLQLQKTNQFLASAENKLGFLNQHKTAVQVTAFTGQGSFANGLKTAQSYAVPDHILPEDKVLNIALSPTAQQTLHARMNDYIVLLTKNQHKARLAHFVDTTSADELRSVVDVFFAKPAEARTFGRQHYLAVNISTQDSPFRGQ